MDTSSVPLKQCSGKEKCVHPEAKDGWLPNSATYFRGRLSRGKYILIAVCIECERAYRTQFYIEHRTELCERSKNYRATHKEQVREALRNYRAEHGDELRAYGRRYREQHPEIHRRQTHIRREHKRGSYLKFTEQDWQRALNYFGGCCAVCGRPPGLWHTLARDHWIPLVGGGEYTPKNLVPLCHSRADGENGCNNTKHKKDPILWLQERYGTRKAKVILKRIETYFEWVRSQADEH